MSVKEVLASLGTWSLTLTDELPEEIRSKFDFFGHVVILRGSVDYTQHDGAALLASARYVGVVREIDFEDTRELSGDSMLVWLGDEDEKGQVFETKKTLTNLTLAQALATVLPDAITLGTVFAQPVPAQRITTTFQYVTPRSAVQTICDTFGVEYRVNGNGTLDAGTQAQLYSATPDTTVVRRGAGTDMDLVALGAAFGVKKSAVDYSTRIMLVGRTQEDSTFVVGTADAPSVPYRDLFGNPVRRTRMISESGTETGTVASRTQLQLNRFNRTTKALKVTADDYEIEGNFVVGDNAYVFDPDTGIVNAANEVFFRGEVLHPDVVRISELSWSITDDHTVLYRAQDGTFYDLTRWVAFEKGSNEIVVGDLPKSLTSPAGNPVLDRSESLPDVSIPDAPTGLTLATTSFVDPVGLNGARVLASWSAPTTNTDGTPLLDLAYYVIHYRPTFRAPQWTTGYSDVASFDFAGTVGLDYDVQVAAVDKAGNSSAFTPVLSITAAIDTTPPAAPSDPSVTSYLGQLRIEWDGLSNTGQAMPLDFNRVDVHVGTTTGFAPSATTLVASLSTKGVAFATAPYGSTRYVRFVAYDHNGNASSASNTVSGSTVQVANGDIASMSVGKLTAGIMTADVTISGRFATALTGARVEVNALGLQKWDSANTLLVSITGTDALLTGRYRSAVTGRRIEMGAAGLLGEIHFYAPDGRDAFVRAYTEGSGLEAIQFGLQIAGKAGSLWNRINYNSQEYSNYRAWRHEFVYQATSTQAAGDGLFQVLETTSSDGSSGNTQRFFIGKNGLFSYHYVSSEDYSIYESSGGTNYRRFWLNDLDVWFPFDRTDQGRIVLQAAQDGTRAARVQLVTPNNWGVTYSHRSNTDGSSARAEIKDVNNSVFQDVWGGAYSNASSITGKTSVAATTFSAREKLRPVKAKTFRRKGQKGLKKVGEKFVEITGPEGAVELGLIAEEVPEEIRTYDETGTLFGINLPATDAMILQYVQELDDRLDEIEMLLRKAKP